MSIILSHTPTEVSVGVKFQVNAWLVPINTLIKCKIALPALSLLKSLFCIIDNYVQIYLYDAGGLIKCLTLK